MQVPEKNGTLPKFLMQQEKERNQSVLKPNMSICMIWFLKDAEAV
jgi:hypothetical protein